MLFGNKDMEIKWYIIDVSIWSTVFLLQISKRNLFFFAFSFHFSCGFWNSFIVHKNLCNIHFFWLIPVLLLFFISLSMMFNNRNINVIIYTFIHLLNGIKVTKRVSKWLDLGFKSRASELARDNWFNNISRKLFKL